MDYENFKKCQTAHKPQKPHGAFPDINILLFAQSSSLVCKNHPNTNKNAKNRPKPPKTSQKPQKIAILAVWHF